jgi:L-threonylcarbamoyladenylate synthase
MKAAMNLALKTRLLPAGPAAIAAAARTLRAGGLVAFPTETVYGLGADAASGEAVARLYAAKGRPSFNPLIAHVPDVDAARRLALFNTDAEQLAATFWPGPLTLVLPRAEGCPVSELATAGLDSIALRVPAHAISREILQAFGGPVVAPSANLSGHVSPTTAHHVEADLDGCIDLIVDGGPTSVGIESTIVSCLDQPALLRPGGISRSEIEAALGKRLAHAIETKDDAPLAPGMLESHYAPRSKLRLNAKRVQNDEALLAFGEPLQGAAVTLNLSPSGNLIEAAAHLFSHLRQLDSQSLQGIAVMPIPNEGLGEAINDRLIRAAAPRQNNPNSSESFD